MSHAQVNPYESSFNPSTQAVAWAGEWERTVFLRRTYSHLAGAIALFTLLEFMVFLLVPEQVLQSTVGFAVSGWNWLFVIGALMLVSTVAEKFASSATSLSTQYLGLGLYVVAEAVIFVPLLWFAGRLGPNTITAAALMTGVIFGGLTMMVFVTRADFSWLGRWLWLAGFGAMGLAICAILFGFSLGILFSGAMVVLASGYILHHTSNVLHHYRTDQYVAASLALFASVATLFWYVLRILSIFNSRD